MRKNEPQDDPGNAADGNARRSQIVHQIFRHSTLVRLTQCRDDDFPFIGTQMERQRETSERDPQASTGAPLPAILGMRGLRTTVARRTFLVMFATAFSFRTNMNAILATRFNSAVRACQDRRCSADNARLLDVGAFIRAKMHAATGRAILDSHHFSSNRRCFSQSAWKW